MSERGSTSKQEWDEMIIRRWGYHAPRKSRLRTTRNQRDRVYARDGHLCRHCGATAYLEIDHIHPVSKGGTNDLENLQVLCQTCNLKKFNHVP
jgi:5-methylcytosine-specific restriction endonuclease McrA